MANIHLVMMKDNVYPFIESCIKAFGDVTEAQRVMQKMDAISRARKQNVVYFISEVPFEP